MAEVATQDDGANTGIVRRETLQNFRGAVGAAVVDEDDLRNKVQSRQRRIQFFTQRGQTLLLIVHGDDDGEIDALFVAVCPCIT